MRRSLTLKHHTSIQPYGWENESIKSDKESVLVLGSGPIRIGQGVEFDYATVHSVKAIQTAWL